MFPLCRPLLCTQLHTLAVDLDPSLVHRAGGWNGEGWASPLLLLVCTCPLNRGSQGVAPEILVAGRRWVEAQSRASNKYDEEELVLSYNRKTTWEEKQAEKQFRDITGKEITSGSWEKIWVALPICLYIMLR